MSVIAGGEWELLECDFADFFDDLVGHGCALLNDLVDLFVQALDLMLVEIHCRDHDDGEVGEFGGLLHLLDDAEAVEFGHHKIEQDDLWELVFAHLIEYGERIDAV